MARMTLAIAAAFAAAFLTQPASSQPEQKLGAVEFETSCTPEAQKLFDHGMLYQHSFWYRASQRAFEDVLKADPECGIAYWGIALSLLWNPARPGAGEESGRWRRRAGKGKERRREDPARARLSRCALPRCTPTTTRSITARASRPMLRPWSSWRSAIRTTTRRRSSTRSPSTPRPHRPTRPTPTSSRARRILEPIFKRQPQHPGVAHYLIHLYDSPPIAEKGLDAARRYAKIAPAAAHAQHMPSHIFTRVGYWKDSIASNAEVGACRESRQGGPRSAARHGLSGLRLSATRAGPKAQGRHRRDDDGHRLHRDLLSRAVRAGRLAGALRDRARRLEGGGGASGAPEPARHVQAITHFARALGAARTGDPAAAKADIAKLVELRDKLREAKDAYWSEQVDIQSQVASAWVLYAEGKYDEALKAMSAAADAEDKTEKHPVTPGRAEARARALRGHAARARHAQRGARCLRGDAEEGAQSAGRLVGAAQAAEKSGDKAKARDYCEKIVAMTVEADATRIEIADARAFLKTP